MALKNAYSKKDPEDTFRDIAEALWDVGADAVSRHQEDGELVGISFQLDIKGRQLPFLIEIDVEGMDRALRKSKKRSDGTHDVGEAQARRTAWKNVHDYILAQLALVQMEQFEPEDVLAGFLYDPQSGRTFGDVVREEPDQFLALPEPDHAG